MKIRKPIPVNTRFDRLVVNGPGRDIPRKDGKVYITSVCTCDCGKVVAVLNCNLKRGNSRSCGCRALEMRKVMHRTHGGSKHPLYTVWIGMMRRCLDSSDKAYNDYGGRGISICKRWRDFNNFASDMNPRPAGKQIDRINNNGDYKKSNCRWATQKQQLRNTRANRVFTISGRTGCMMELCEYFGLKYATVRQRLANGWNPHDVFTKKVNSLQGTPTSGVKLAQKQFRSVFAEAKKRRLNPKMVCERLRAGWSVKDAFNTPKMVQ